MDVSRAVLDNLMGRDRNKSLDMITQRDHYSNPDVLIQSHSKVCKSFLVCFCFNTLFPNTTYDQGPCQKRHDTYLKNMFDSDPSRAQYQRQYIRECIHWIQRRLQEVQKKTKQNQSVIDNKSNFPTDRPKQILDRILAIDQDIQKLIADSQKFGQQGKIDDSVRCLEEVEKLRQRRKQIELMGSDMTNAQKQQKICTICGAIQTINDTEKRIQTHLQGKIHQGFLKLRHEVEILKIRLEVLNKMNPPEKKERQDHQRRRQENQRRREQKKQEVEKKVQKPKETQPQRNNQNRTQKQQRDRSDSASRRRKKQRSRQRSRQRRQKQQDREKARDGKQKDRRSRSRDKKDRKHHRDSKERENKDRTHKESKEHKKKHKKNRSRSKERQMGQER